MSNTLRRSTALLAAFCAIGCAAPALATPFLVTSTNDSGEGSLRAAFDAAASAGTAAQIVIMVDGTIEITSTLAYGGTAALALIGNGQTIASAQNVTLLAATQGADLTVMGLAFEGPGGFDIEARGDLDGPAGKGIFVDVRDDQTGTVTLRLEDVSVTGTAGHGIHISDCTLADDCGGGAGGAGEGSDASVALMLNNVAVIDTARGRFDADGVRVDERGNGGVTFMAVDSVFEGVGADGIELDEGQDGSVIATIINSAFQRNGDYCDPARLGQFMPDEDEGEYDEEGPGDIGVTFINTTGDDNTDDAFKMSEADEGGVFGTVHNASASGNGGVGFVFEEEDKDDVMVTLSNVATSGNDDGDLGLEIVQDDEGMGDAIVLNSDIADGIEVEGVTLSTD